MRVNFVRRVGRASYRSLSRIAMPAYHTLAICCRRCTRARGLSRNLGTPRGESVQHGHRRGAVAGRRSRATRRHDFAESVAARWRCVSFGARERCLRNRHSVCGIRQRRLPLDPAHHRLWGRRRNRLYSHEGKCSLVLRYRGGRSTWHCDGAFRLELKIIPAMLRYSFNQ